MDFFVRLDTVNLRALFGDCSDLSAIRGGGLSVLNIADRIPEGEGLERLSEGPSQAIFRVTADDASSAEGRVRTAIRAITDEDIQEILESVTFMVSAVPHDPNAFQAQNAAVTASNRWQQLRAPTVAYPRLETDWVCTVDKLRPAPRDVQRSRFTNARREYGRRQKHRLLDTLLGEQKGEGVAAARHLSELSDGGPSYGRLNGKNCVIRLDGNDFGQRFSGMRDLQGYRELSARLRANQSAFFRALLLDGQGQIGRQWLRDSRLLIEILVYGGDEISIVVPAWLGWSTLRQFYQHLHQQNIHETYSGAIIFCHHNAPIHAIRALASNLVDEAKNRAPGGKGNFSICQVLETFDAIGEETEDYLKRRYEFCNRHDMLLSPEALRHFDERMAMYRRSLAKRQLHRLVQSVVKEHSYEPRRDGKKLLAEDSSEAELALESLTELHTYLPGGSSVVHLLELWDYCQPVLPGGGDAQ